MDVLGGEDVHQLREHILQEGKDGVVAGAEDVLGHAPAGPHLIRTAGATQLRIGGEGCHHVARKVHFRNHGNATGGGIGHHFLHFLLRVETAVTDAVVGAPVLLDDGSVAPRAHFHELGIGLDFRAPALVVGEVPVQAVQFVYGHYIQVTFHLIHAPEVTGNVQVHTPVGKARLVLDAHIRQHPVGLGLFSAVNGGREHLLEGFAGIDKAVQGRCLHHHAVFAYLDGVLLGGQLRIHQELDVALSQRARPAGSGLQGIFEAPDGILRGVIQARVQEKGLSGYRVGALRDGNLRRHGNYTEGLRLHLTASGQGQHSGKNKTVFSHMIEVVSWLHL